LLQALEIPRDFFPETVLESEEIAGYLHIYRELYPALQQKFADQARLVRKWS